MRRLFPFVAFLSLALAPLPAILADEVPWLTDMDQAFRLARQQNRPILIHFWSPDCVPCMRLEENVFNRPSVSKTLSDLFVPLKVNAKQHPELATKYDIRSVPWDVIVTPADKELHRMLTPQDPERYVAQLSATAFRAGMVPRRNPQDRFGPPTKKVAYDSQLGPLPGMPARSVSTLLAGETPVSTSPAVETQEPEAKEVINRFARRNSRPNPAYAHEPATAHSTESDWVPESDWETWPRSDSRAVSEDVRQSNHRRAPMSRQAQNAPRQDAAAVSQRNAAEATRATPRHQSKPQRAPHNPLPRTQPNIPAPLGMDGYCPVTLLKSDVWKKGDRRYGIIHRGRTYLFAGPQERESFLSSPDDYSPVLAGIDPVLLADSGEAAEGNRAHGVVYRKRVYLFTTEENLQRFWQQPERYASPIRQAMETGTVNRLFR